MTIGTPVQYVTPSTGVISAGQITAVGVGGRYTVRVNSDDLDSFMPDVPAEEDAGPGEPYVRVVPA